MCTNRNNHRNVNYPTTVVKQSRLNDFNVSSTPLSIHEKLNTATSKTVFHHNSAYHCSCKKDYSLLSDLYIWRRPEEPDDCSRADIKRACRLGMWY